MTPSMLMVSRLAAFSPEDRWDFDKLVNKWKRHVREDRARRGGGSMLPPLSDGVDTSRVGTPPSSIRTQSVPGVLPNGQKSASTTNSPLAHNGTHSGSMSITDKPGTFASNSMHRPFAGTPNNASSNLNPSSHTQTPYQNQNVSIISDLPDHMARFAPWFEQEKREKLQIEHDGSANGE